MSKLSFADSIKRNHAKDMLRILVQNHERAQWLNEHGYPEEYIRRHMADGWEISDIFEYVLDQYSTSELNEFIK